MKVKLKEKIKILSAGSPKSEVIDSWDFGLQTHESLNN